MKKKLKFWSIPVPEGLNTCVEAAVRLKSHVSKADFVRDAVREKLARMNLRANVKLEEPQENEQENEFE